MQEKRRWFPPQGPLGRLTSAAEGRAIELRRQEASLRARARDLPAPPSFSAALRAGDRISVIAEIKRRSPSKGAINETIRAGDRAVEYAAAGARALSVLTEPNEFGGALADLLDVAARVDIPILKKDFHVDESQVWEARASGAAAILFIARAIAPDRLSALVDASHEAGLEVLVEVRSEWEVERALATTAAAIGVNARDLETLAIEPWVTERLMASIPASRARVAESGMRDADDVVRAAALGADAVLIGSSLSSSSDPERTLRALAAVPRRSRAG